MMRRHLTLLTTVLLVAVSALVAGSVRWAWADEVEVSPILAAYDFEAPVASGPDTFWLRAREGSVDLSAAFRVSGERSLHLREVAGDRDFSEFLAYFDERREGAVFIQFHLLLTDPGETLNIGLAGTQWFLSPVKHGHAVWLQSGDGELRHRPARGFQTLFEPRPFAWYFVDLVYDIDRGRYDLAIYEEGTEEPIVDLRGERNYADSDGSSVRYFSLIGDLEDEDGFDFFVDDLLIASDPAVLQKPFVAPGRRQLFVERFALQKGKLPDESDEDLLAFARRTLRPSFDAVSLESNAPVLERLEAAGDASFATLDLDLAETIYSLLGERSDRRVRMWLKLADVAHLRGDADGERRLREAVYGSLRFAENE